MGKQMRIKIKENASSVYLRDLHRTPINWEWAETLTKIQGKWLVVETDFLFRDQFNTPPIDGVSDIGLRIMENLVSEVENDARKELVKCRNCGKHEKWTKWEFREDDKGAFCPNCGSTGYADPLHGFSRTALNMKSHGLHVRGLGVKNDEESWYATMVFSNDEKIKGMSDDDLLSIVGWSYYYGGPGRAFAHEPWVKRSEKVVVVKQHGGLDI